MVFHFQSSNISPITVSDKKDQSKLESKYIKFSYLPIGYLSNTKVLTKVIVSNWSFKLHYCRQNKCLAQKIHLLPYRLR